MADPIVACLRDRSLTSLLRVLGTVELLAIAVVFLPDELLLSLSAPASQMPDG
jgi:hypothetical protein